MSFVKSCHSNKRKLIFFILFLVEIISIAIAFCSCKTQINYFEYVSELRSNILLGETEGLYARVYAIEKEQPYIADGIKRTVNKRTEIYLTAQTSEKEYILSFETNGQTYKGDTVYDNVKSEYYFSCDADVSMLSDLMLYIEYDGHKVALNTTSARNENTLSPEDAFHQLYNENVKLFENLTDKYGFTGEIYIRLIYEDAAYYYFGVIEKNGKITAFLMNAESGKILAKREN